MKENIERYDKNGIRLKEGDIIAECTIGESIWEDKGVILSRPLGIVQVYHNVNTTASLNPDENDSYNIIPIRKGSVQLTDKADKWMVNNLGNDERISELNISRYDGDFYAWDNIEVIGSIYNMDK